MILENPSKGMLIVNVPVVVILHLSGSLLHALIHSTKSKNLDDWSKQLNILPGNL